MPILATSIYGRLPDQAQPFVGVDPSLPALAIGLSAPRSGQSLRGHGDHPSKAFPLMCSSHPPTCYLPQESRLEPDHAD